MIYITYYESPIGRLLLSGKGEALTGLWINGQNYYMEISDIEIIQKDDEEIFIQTKEWLDMYFNGKNPDITELKILPSGNEFRQQVWKLLCDIPYGKVTTYGELAKQMAVIMNKKNMSAQAVGGAVKHNPISIIIPCHRVIGAKGNLTGYAGGMENKIKLLEIEKTEMSGFYVPVKKMKGGSINVRK